MDCVWGFENLWAATAMHASALLPDQEVVANLMIAAIEFRGEEDADVAPYRHATASEVLTVQPSGEVGAARAALFASFRRVMGELGSSRVRPALKPVSQYLFLGRWLQVQSDGESSGCSGG